MGAQFVDEQTVLAVGAPGEWDAGALGSMSVVRVGRTCHMYYEAWGHRTDKAWDQQEYHSLQIGHATSTDGITWRKDAASPVLRRGGPGDWDHHGTWDPFVLYEDGLYKMWHGGGADDHCDWGYATSTDGVHFEKHGRISRLGNVEDVHIVRDEPAGLYHIYYWDRAREPAGLRHAVSPNETDFDFDHADTVEIAGETGMSKFTHVIRERGVWYMFYSNFVRPHCANATIRLAASDDGVRWVARNRDLLAGQDGEVLNIARDRWLMYFGPAGCFDRKGCSIRVATYDGELADLVDRA